MMSLNYYLRLSARGDHEAAYQAAQIMHHEGRSDLSVQAQLRHAASCGSTRAMRWLGFIGLSEKLITPQSSLTNLSYYKGFEQAYQWFSQGAIQGDTVCIIATGFCLLHGIGVTQDMQKSKELISGVTDRVSVEAIVPIIFLLNTLVPTTPQFRESIHHNLIDEMSGTKGGQHGEDQNY